jgi:hypothetical protein
MQKGLRRPLPLAVGPLPFPLLLPSRIRRLLGPSPPFGCPAAPPAPEVFLGLGVDFGSPNSGARPIRVANALDPTAMKIPRRGQLP